MISHFRPHSKREAFKEKMKASGHKPVKIPLAHGDLVIMAGECQTYWEHAILKQDRVTGMRISLTFRKLV